MKDLWWLGLLLTACGGSDRPVVQQPPKPPVVVPPPPPHPPPVDTTPISRTVQSIQINLGCVDTICTRDSLRWSIVVLRSGDTVIERYDYQTHRTTRPKGN